MDYDNIKVTINNSNNNSANQITENITTNSNKKIDLKNGKNITRNRRSIR